MVERQVDAVLVVDADQAGDVGGRLVTDQHRRLVALEQRQQPSAGQAGAVEDDAVDAAVLEGVQHRLLVRGVLEDVVEEHAVAVLPGGDLGALGDLGVVGVAEVLDDEAEAEAALRRQAAGDAARAVAELVDHLQHPGGGLGAGLPFAVHHPRHGLLGNPGLAGDIGHRYAAHRR